MAPTDHRKRVRIFLSSPSDVAEERRLAAELIDVRLRKHPLISQTHSLELVRWDDKDAPTPFEAQRDAQSSVDWAKGRPSDCNLVIVILWSRLGTAFERGGRSWGSGTEYEYEDAARAASPPPIYVYRRAEELLIGARDPERDAKIEQLDAVDAFIQRIKAHTRYSTPVEFRDRLESDLRQFWPSKKAEIRTAPSPAPFSTALASRPSPPPPSALALRA